MTQTSPWATPRESTPEDVIVRVTGLCKAYGRSGSRITALRDVDLEIGRGERLAILGRSGSGKSTLLNLLGGLDRPTSGRVIVAGQDLAELSASALADYRLTTVGMIFQAYNLIAGRSALDNVELPLVFAGRSPSERRGCARDALESVGLGARMSHRPLELSGGERQRVAIARALVHRPVLVLADEPTGNLDSSTAEEVMRLLLDQVARDGATLVLVTHDEELARRSSDRIIHMKDGRVAS
jgi:ABC-type lipoprotein export system ATPase subunit